MTVRTAARRTLLAATVVVALGACTTGRPDEEPISPAVGSPAGSEPSTADPATTAVPPVPQDGTTPVDVDTAPAREVVLAMATGDDTADISQYLHGEDAASKVDEVVSRGAQVNASTLSRFGTTRHARTLDSYETVEHSTANVTMITIITVGWDAPPDDESLPDRLQHNVVPGSPGTLAWYLTVDTAGLVTGVWEEAEVGDMD